MFRRRSDHDFQAEIESHIRLEADRLISEGVPPDDAWHAAQRTFGNTAQVEERFFESHRWLWWEQLRQDLRYGCRSLLQAPAFTAAAVLTVALGVGANTAIFSLMDAILLRSLAVHQPDELLFVRAMDSGGSSATPPYPCFAQMRREVRSFAGMAAFAGDELRIAIDGQPEQVMGQIASGSYFEVLGVRPRLGRLMTAEDDSLNPPVAVISDRYWQRRFGGDPSVIGRTITFRQQSFTIIGVTAPEFFGTEPGRRVDVTLPITVEQSASLSSELWWLHGIVARIKPGVQPGPAQSEADSVFRSFMASSPQSIRRFHRLELQPAARGVDSLRRRFSTPLLVLMGLVSLVLLMAVVNIANLLLSRGITRTHEFAIRLATGASAGRLVRQLLTETLLLFALGAIAGILLAAFGTGLLQGMFAEGRRPLLVEADLNWRVLAFTLAITLSAGLLASLLPIWRVLRIDPERAIREGDTRSSESRGAGTLRQSLIAFQVALSLVLLTGALTFVRTLYNLRHVNPGFHNDQALTMSVDLPDRYVKSGQSAAIWPSMLEEIRRIPGIQSAAISTFTPLSGRNRREPVQVRGHELRNPEDALIHVNLISEGYFETLGIPLVRGRLLTGRDESGSPDIALINQSAARRLFGDRDPLGQSVELPRKELPRRAYQIVGVVGDTKHLSLREQAAEFVFLPLRQPRDAERRITLTVLAEEPSLLVEPIRKRLAEVEPQLMISDVMTIRRQIDTTLLTERMLSGLATAFGLLALILASTGLFGVLSYRIAQQRKSIGVRIALGARPSAVAFGIIRHSALLITSGLIVGLPVAILAAGTADSMLWGVSPGDPAVYLAGAAILAAAGCLSAWIPARRAASIDPAEVLRYN